MERIGRLTPIRDGAYTQWLLESDSAPTSLFEGEFKEGLYPGWPWFLEDMRPSGFLGREFAKHMAEILQVDKDPEKWSDLELLKILDRHGDNLHGNLILGDGNALKAYQESRVKVVDGRYEDWSHEVYVNLAD